METELDAQMAWTNEKVIITVDVPYGPGARKAADMSGITADTLFYSPKTGLVESAESIINGSNDLEYDAPDFWASLSEEEQDEVQPLDFLPHLDRAAWESLLDDANIAICQIVDPRVIAARRVRDRRRTLGLSQSDLAQRLGVKQPTLSQWESGVRPLPEGVDREITIMETQQESLTLTIMDVLMGRLDPEGFEEPLVIDEDDVLQTVARADAYRRLRRKLPPLAAGAIQ